ncbi:MAG TPA: SDR family oxidoreductase [Aggregatilineales bacterium]|nr:SDR family oxidoreductase [Anaerolineales bacterium]HRE47955.1 SDR family oxidoreductase [Aggregatilineales bacterium]
MNLDLSGKVVMVAAASKGLGYGIARAAAHEGARVYVCSRDAEAIRAAAERLAAESGAAVQPFACDVTTPDGIAAWVESVRGREERIDALAVNTGGPPAGLFLELTDDHWQAAFNLLLMSAIRLIRAVVPHMTAGGAILTVTSSSVKEPIERLALSTVMRAGVTALVKTLADELAPHKIRINTLIPGRIDTERVAHLDAITAEKTGKPIEQVRAETVGRIPLKRLGSIEEFGAAGAFLLSPAASYITGAALRVDGGAMRSITS